MSAPYYEDKSVQIYLGDCREILPTLTITPDAAICDPPYGTTSLSWDQWPVGWPQVVAGITSSMWCFGSLRMFLVRGHEFAAGSWQLSHDVVWRKHNGSGFHADRFRGVHELVAHWYRGRWESIRHQVPRIVGGDGKRHVRHRGHTPHTGKIASTGYTDDGKRLTSSVIDARSMHGQAIHPTEKPVAVLAPLIEYAVPPAGLVLDPMAGSCSTALAATLTGRRAICIEARESYAEIAARRLDQGLLDLFGD